MKFDEILRDHVGEFGKYQRLIIIPIVATCVVVGVLLLEIVLTGQGVDHWCDVPKPQQLENVSREQWLNETIPWEFGSGEWRRSQCYTYTSDMTNSNGSSSNDGEEKDVTSRPNSTELMACTKHEFDQSSPSTLVSEWGLVCEKRYLVSALKSTLMAGLMTGAALGGFLADRFGRRTMLLAMIILCPIVRIFTMFPQHFFVLMASHFLYDLCAAAIYVISFTLAVELVGCKWRALVGTLVIIMYAGGILLTALFGYLLRERLYIQIAITTTSLPFLALICTLPESPRWLYAKGRHAEGRATLELFAKRNGTHFPKDVEVTAKDGDNTADVKLWHLFSTVTLALRAFIVIFAWFAVAFCYFGLTLNIGSLAGDIYLNLFLTGMLEILAYILSFIAIRSPLLGRRITNSSLYILAGLSLLCTLAVPTHLPIITTVLATFGRMCVAGAFSAIYIWTAEVFPTAVRSTALSTASWIGKIGAILAPLTENLVVYSPVLPTIIFGTISLCAGLVLLLLPETFNRPLPQTIGDMKA